MRYPEQFDDIRRLYDEEVRDALKVITSQPFLKQMLALVLGTDFTEYFLNNLGDIDTVDGFQKQVIGVLLTSLEHRTCRDVRMYGFENVDREKGNLFISNHRDIILDSAFLNSHLFYKGLKTTQIAIGNNLLAAPWITNAVRLNKSFIVKRDGSIKEQILISRHLSEYIRMVRTQFDESIWIAQREGRAKNSDDRTQPSVLKMFSMSGPRDIAESLEELNITPVSINYEFDPCDVLKACEAQLKRDVTGYKKSQADDVLSMKTGLLGYKGRVSFVINKPVTGLSKIAGDAPRNEQAELIAAAIDKSIHSGYMLFPNNYVAADMMLGGYTFSDKYTDADKAAFTGYLEKRVAEVDMEGKDIDFLKEKIIEMYANPAINQSRALGNG